VKPPRSPVSRRAVLRGLRGRTENPPLTRSTDHAVGDLLKATRQGMGSYFEVRIPVGTPMGIDLATRALDVVEELEAQLTVYRDDSEVSRLNASAHEAPVAVELGLFALLQRAVEIGSATGGAYDVTAGALSLAWGFTKGPKRVPDPETLDDARARTGQQHMVLDTESRSVAFDRPGIVINLGSIGKGYAIDRAADLIRSHFWPTPGLIHGGRSSLYALGSPPDRFGGRWEVALRNPFDSSKPLGTIRLRNRALGTSGTDFQNFEANGRVYGHILDPRTGEPASSGPASVTVLAPTAAEADALSTAFYLIGPDSAASYIARHPEVGALFVQRNSQTDDPDVLMIGLTVADFEPSLEIQPRAFRIALQAS
jgi:FAD:protein FMN transferase